MIVTQEQVEKLAYLARLGLTSEEVQRFSGQLDEIMTFFEKLQQVDTTETEPVSQITGLSNVAREDVPQSSGLSDALLDCSPLETQNRQVRVQKAL